MREERTNAVIFMADGFEEIEAVTVIDILRRAEIKIEVISIKDKPGTIGAHGLKLLCDSVLENSREKIEEAGIIILPGGGLGTENLKASAKLAGILTAANESGKLIAAICAAPSVLGALGILDGRDAVCYPGVESELTSARIQSENVVVCGNVITAKAAGAAHEFAFKIVELLDDSVGLSGKKNAERIRGQMYY